MLRRSLLYTAITRARQAVYIVGQEVALKYAIQNDDNLTQGAPRRWTLLGSMLERRKQEQERH